MCGISAILSLNKNKINLSECKVLLEQIKTRGPDNQNIWFNKKKNLSLIVARLATKDTSKNANQPLFSYDKKSIIIMNGEIYNYEKLKKRLIDKYGCKFLTLNDAEVIVNGINLEGEKFVRLIEGQFAFIYYNISRNIKIIARDRYGICPLYYYKNKDMIYFSSTPDSFFKLINFNKKVNKQAFVDFYISDTITNGETFFQNVKYLKNNQMMIIKDKKILKRNIETYKIKNFKKIKNYKFEDAINQINNNLIQSVKDCFYGNKNVGVNLSSGIDSFGILSILNKLYPQKKIHSFTANFINMDNTKLVVGEGEIVQQNIKKFKTINHQVNINYKDLLNDLKNSKYPSSSILNITNKKLAKEAKKNNISVVLSGEGADEIFLGYDHFLAVISIFDEKYKILKKNFRLRSKVKKKLPKLKFFDCFLGGGAEINLSQNLRKILKNKQIGKLYDFEKRLLKHLSKTKLIKKLSIDQKLPFIDYNLKVPENLMRRAEGPAMSEGVEMRFPYLNNKIIEFVYNLPLSFKIKNFDTKSLLRETLKLHLPNNIIKIPKSPFGLPAARNKHYKKSKLIFKKPAFKSFFFNQIDQIEKIILFGKMSKLGIFDTKYLQKIINIQKNKKTMFFDTKIWKLWSMSEWAERYL